MTFDDDVVMIHDNGDDGTCLWCLSLLYLSCKS